MEKIKAFTVNIFAFLIILSVSSCKSESKELPKEKENYIDVSELTQQQNKEIADNTKSSSKSNIFVASSVTPAKPGNLVDFVWQQDGKEKRFSEYVKGKVVLLNFWGTWCPPCRREIPDLVSIHNESNGKDYVIVGVVLERDIDNAERNVGDFASKNGIGYLNIIDKNQSIARAYGGINAVPTTFVIDKKGRIVETLVGMRSKAEFLEAITRASK